MATNSGSNIVTAAAGKVLQGAGVGVANVFSTATYPSTATLTGTILRADGTNWSATTATFPNTAGTSGNVLTSDGTNWTSSAAPGGGVTTVTGSITSAQIKALHATPITIISAPGSGKVIQVTASAMKFNYGGSNVFVAGASQNVKLYYSTTTQLSGNGISNSTLVGTATTYQFPNTISAQTAAAAAVENLAVTLYNDVATEISGNAANNNTITYSVSYIVLSI